MKTFRRRDNRVEAVQWFKDGDSDLVKPDSLQFLQRGAAYYLTGFNHAAVWLTFDKLADKPTSEPMAAVLEYSSAKEPTYYRIAFPFMMYDFKGDKKYTDFDAANPDHVRLKEDWLLADSQYTRVSNDDYQVVGRLYLPDTNGRVAVYPGNWLVRASGKVTIMEDAKFQLEFEADGAE
jgi:hypothetical protein